MRYASLGFAAFIVLLWGAEAVLLQGTWFNALLLWLPHGFLLAPAFLLLMAAAFRQARLEAACVGAASLVVVFAFSSFTVPWRRAQATVNEVPLAVVTYNIEGGAGGAQALRATLEEAAADVVLLQEAHPMRAEPALVPHGPQGWHVRQVGELALMSRHPIRECHEERVDVPDSDRSCLVASLDVRGTTVHVVNFHHSILFPGANLFRDLRAIPAWMSQNQQVHQRETDALLRIGQRVRGPLIVAGDFTAPPRDADVARIRATWSDTFARGGFGFGNTIDSSLPIIRVDYILTTADIGVTRCEAIASTASGHFPLRAQLLVPASR